MGKKYIIEIPDDRIADFIGSTHFLMPYMMAGHIGHHDTGLPIKPYTEPDINEAYQRGAEDMQKALRLLIGCDEGCLTIPDMFKAFGEGSYHAVVRKHPAMEIIEKIQAYEREQEEQIQVGDEVKGGDERYVVLQKYFNNIDEPMAVLFNRRNGEINKWHLYNANGAIFEKIGRTFPEIAEMLRKIKEN